jgi:hypothetical protein
MLRAGGTGAAVGLIHTSHGSAPPLGVDLPLTDTVTLAPWSPEALTAWLRTMLQGEPSQQLLEWLTARSRRLPALAERELAVLVESGGLERTAAGNWTVSRSTLARAPRPRRPLPAAMTDLLGRERETAQVTELAANRRLVTLVGLVGPDQAAWTARVGREYGNLRAAMEWMWETGAWATAAHTAANLRCYWRSGQSIGEGRAWLDRILDERDQLPRPALARALHAWVMLAHI